MDRRRDARGALGADVDYAQLVKIYGAPIEGEKRYSPPECLGAVKTYVERSNLTMRMSMRRFTRLTNAHSKKLENHCQAVAIYFVWYNWARINSAVRVSIDHPKRRKVQTETVPASPIALRRPWRTVLIGFLVAVQWWDECSLTGEQRG